MFEKQCEISHFSFKKKKERKEDVSHGQELAGAEFPLPLIWGMWGPNWLYSLTLPLRPLEASKVSLITEALEAARRGSDFPSK